jgi:hypothetical protein
MTYESRGQLSVTLITSVCVFLSATAAAAQTPKVEVAGGYTLLHDPDTSGNFPTGWFVAAGSKLAIGKFRKDWLGAVGELTANYKNISSLGYDLTLISYSFMGGPRFTPRQRKKLLPSAQFLAGGAVEKVSSTELDIHGSVTHFAFEPGGMVDLIVASRFAIRAGANERFVVMPRHTTKEFQVLAGGVVFWR